MAVRVIKMAPEIEALIKQAAREAAEAASEAGATRALERVGLHDAEAGDDVRDLRTLLDAWRGAKRTVLETAVRLFTTAMVGALLVGAWWNWPKLK